MSPVLLHFPWHLCVTVPGQIYDAPVVTEVKKVDQLSAAGCLAGSGQPSAIEDGVYGAGLPRVATAGKGDLPATIRRKLLRLMGALYELCLREQRHSWVIGDGSERV